MMRLVLDTNQIDPIINSPVECEFNSTELLVPPYVWCEIINSNKASKRLNAIKNKSIRFGMELGDAWESLTKEPTENHIHDFDFTYPCDSPQHLFFFAAFDEVTSKHKKTAERMRSSACTHTGNFGDKLILSRKEQRDRRSGGEDIPIKPKYESMDEVDDSLILNEDSSFYRFHLDIADGIDWNTSSILSKNTFVEALFSNPSYLRFLRSIHVYSLSYQNLWSDKELNKNEATYERNDIPDMSLALYSRNGDVVLTADKKLKSVLLKYDSENELKVRTWNEWLEEGPLSKYI